MLSFVGRVNVMDSDWQAPADTVEDHDDPSPLSKHREEMRIKRKARNREAAKTSRTRKKQQIELLEGKIQLLTSEADTLRREMASGRHADSPFNKGRHRHFPNLAAALANPLVPDEEIRKLLSDMRLDLGAEGKDRVDSLNTSFKSLLEVMIPHTLLYFLWRNSPSAAQTLVENLPSHLQLTPHQREIFANCESVLMQHQSHLCSGLEGLRGMVNRIAQHARVIDEQMERLSEVLSARQVAMLLIWLRKNYDYLDTEKVLNYGQNATMMIEGE